MCQPSSGASLLSILPILLSLLLSFSHPTLPVAFLFFLILSFILFLVGYFVSFGAEEDIRHYYTEMGRE